MSSAKPFDASGILGIDDMPAYLQKIEAELVRATTTDNPALQVPITRLVHAGSKRLRSVLVIAVATSQGKAIDDHVISGCVAIELVHIASLVHDDIIDHAQTRWGVPTVNSREGTDNAILVGDYLFAMANVLAAGIGHEAAELVANTIVALIDGESREVADEFNIDRSVDAYMSAITGKTSALVSAACQMGGICTSMDGNDIRALASFGEAFGIAFQLIDDTLDFLSTDKLLGKPTGNDVKEGVYNLPVLLAMQGDRSSEVRFLLTSKQPDITKLISMIEDSSAFEQTIQMAKDHNQRATLALDGMKGSSRLVRLPDEYMKWAFTNLIDSTVRKITTTFV